MPKKKLLNTYRSKFEEEVAKYFGKNVLYEPERISYIQPQVERIYVPDFVTTNGIYLEAKGYWDASDRKKHILIREQYPNRRFILIFMNSSVTLNKRSKTTYADFCEKHGLEYYCWKYKKPPKTIKGLINNANRPHSRNTGRQSDIPRRTITRRSKSTA